MEAVLINKRDLALKLGVSERHIDNLVAKGRFPKPVRLGRSVRWRVTEVNQWIKTKRISDSN